MLFVETFAIFMPKSTSFYIIMYDIMIKYLSHYVVIILCFLCQAISSWDC